MKRFMIAFVAAATFAAGMGTASGAAAVGAASPEVERAVDFTLAGTIQPGVLGSAGGPTDERIAWGEFPHTVKAMATVMASQSDAVPSYVGLMIDTEGGLWNFSVKTHTDFMFWTAYNVTIVRAGSGYGGVRDMVAADPTQQLAAFPDDLYYVYGTPYVYLLTATSLQRAAVTPGLRLSSGKAASGAYGDIATLAWGGRRSINGTVKDVLIATTKSGALVEIRVGSSLTDVKRVVLKPSGFAGLRTLGVEYKYSSVGHYTGITPSGLKTTWRDTNVFNGSGTDITKVGSQQTTMTAPLVEGSFPWTDSEDFSSYVVNAPFGYYPDVSPDAVLPDGEVPGEDVRVSSAPKALVVTHDNPHAVLGVKHDGTLVRYERQASEGAFSKEVVLKRGWTYVRDLVKSEGRYVYALTTGSITRYTVSNGTLVSGVKVPGDYSDVAELGFFSQSRPFSLGTPPSDKLVATTKSGGLVQISVSRTTTPTVQRQTWATSGYDGVTAIAGAMFGPGAPKISFLTLVKGQEAYRLMNRNTGGIAAMVGLGAQTESGRYTGHVGTVVGYRY